MRLTQGKADRQVRHGLTRRVRLRESEQLLYSCHCHILFFFLSSLFAGICYSIPGSTNTKWNKNRFFVVRRLVKNTDEVSRLAVWAVPPGISYLQRGVSITLVNRSLAAMVSTWQLRTDSSSF